MKYTITYVLIGMFLVSGCAKPCPPLERNYTCPPHLGTTWGAEDEHGCVRWVCSVGGRGGFVESP